LFTSLGSVIIGAFGALKQIRIKRFLAYTSINQVGFILLGVSCCSLLGLIASITYLFLYIIMNLIFFSIFLRTEHAIIEKNVIYLSDLYGISSYSYETSIHFSITILSMSGLPPLGGFFGKLFIYFSAIEARLDFSLLCTLLISVLSTYYYLNCIRYILFEKRGESKLYYFIKDKNLTVFLRLCSFFLVLFPILLPITLDFFVKLSFSCAYPFICG
jgi:NADH-quinone oxidoreductase subunit N